MKDPAFAKASAGKEGPGYRAIQNLFRNI